EGLARRIGLATAVAVEHRAAARGVARRNSARIFEVEGVLDDGGEVRLGGAAEIPVIAIIDVLFEPVRPLAAAGDAGGHARIGEAYGRTRLLRIVGADIDPPRLD